MKDLYKRNNLSALENDHVKISNCKSASAEDNEAAFSILLNRERKKQYDKVYKTLTTVARLRAHFSIADKNAWSHSYPDFLISDILSKQESIIPEKTKGADADQSEKRYAHVTYSFLLLLPFVIGYFWLTGQSNSNEFIENGMEPITIWKYAAVDNLPVYNSPDINADVIGEVPRFEDTRVFVDKDIGAWDFMHYGKLEGYALKENLIEGDGKEAYTQNCKTMGVSRLRNGQVLIRPLPGTNSLTVINPPGMDAVFKLKNRRGEDIVFYYVQGGESFSLNDIPDGEYFFSYATGSQFSLACGRFLEKMQAWKNETSIAFKAEVVNTLEYNTTLTVTLKNQFETNTWVDPRHF